MADTFLIAGNTCLLGWWDGAWENGGPPPVTGGEVYQVVSLGEPISAATGSEPREWCDPLGLTNIEFDPPLPGVFLDLDAIAVQTTSDVQPNGVEMLSATPDSYVESTADLLWEVAQVPVVNITQAIRTDLEGDGVDEVIIAASTVPDDFVSTAVSDYSILYVRKLIDGEVQTAVLAKSIIMSQDDLLQGVAVHNVAAVVDLNGDGKMEIVVNSTFWEGASLQVFEWVDNDLGPVEVLYCGCGS